MLKSAKHTILRKLLWYREGGGVSVRQWRDVLGVLRGQRGTLDMGYVRDWAALGKSEFGANTRVAMAHIDETKLASTKPRYDIPSGGSRAGCLSCWAR